MKSAAFGFHVCLHFAAHPDAALSSAAIADMFDEAHVAAKLQEVVKAGYLTAEGGRGKGHLRIYRAGERLKKLISKEVPK